MSSDCSRTSCAPESIRLESKSAIYVDLSTFTNYFPLVSTLGNVTDSIVNIDEIKVHENKDGSVDKTKTDLYMHLVEREDNSIYEVSEVLKLIDTHIESLDELFKDLNVLDTQPAEAQLLMPSPTKGAMFVWLVFTNLFLASLLVVTLALCASQRKGYKRQLRAAKVNIFRKLRYQHNPSLC